MSRSSRRLLIGAGAVFVFALLATGLYFTFRYTLLADVREAIANASSSDTLAYGQTLFTTRGCSACHSLASVGAAGDEGPDLSDIGARHDNAYIRQSIVEPNAVIADACPEGPCQPDVMPAYGTMLNAEQVDALVAFLTAQHGD
jgi:mono/diheme cytochrome c family protein